MTSKLSIYFTPKAEEDLETIYEFSFLTWGLDKAEQYQDDIYHSIKEITHSPEIGRLHKGDNEMYRTLVVRRYIIYYKQKKSTIIVVRILHGSMDRERWIE